MSNADQSHTAEIVHLLGFSDSHMQAQLSWPNLLSRPGPFSTLPIPLASSVPRHAYFLSRKLWALVSRGLGQTAIAYFVRPPEELWIGQLS